MSHAAMEVLLTDQHDRWMAVLEESFQHDFHHLPSYHRVEEQRGEGTAHLFTYREQGCMIALPLLLRPVEAADPSGWQDATSAYGYGGPVASLEVLPPGVAGGFQAALRAELVSRRVVAAFSRMHPLIPQGTVFTEMGECRESGETVSIDLGAPEDQQLAGYSRSCRRNIRRLENAGFSGLLDAEKRHLGAFVAIYHETMRRVGARPSYYYDEAYFRLLAQELGPALQLFVVVHEGEVVAGSLATSCAGIVQDHLGGTLDRFRDQSPDRLLIETERRWAVQHGARVLHLGGGVSGEADSVFQYKAAFSDRRHRFQTWRCVLQPGIYEELRTARERRNVDQGLVVIAPEYFPAYRAPTSAVSGPTL